MKLTSWIGLITIALLAIAYLWVSNDPQTQDGGSGRKPQNPVLLNEAELIDYEDNRTKWHLRARHTKTYEEQNLTLLDDLEGDVFSKNPRQKATRFQADFGKIEGKDQLMSVWGDVHVDFQNGQSLFTEQLFFDQRKEMIYNQVEVRVISNQDTILGSSMHYDMNTGILVLTEPRADLNFDS